MQSITFRFGVSSKECTEGAQLGAFSAVTILCHGFPILEWYPFYA